MEFSRVQLTNRPHIPKISQWNVIISLEFIIIIFLHGSHWSRAHMMSGVDFQAISMTFFSLNEISFDEMM